ncbi:T9SS type A sorting domain-containing protein [Chryseobacterium sp. SN22]|uniref:T9SS type A sorting domain-containing protein n=1 Tax=Chryseobacterium sp. SN22 TaxID=2606431 RepID=UPI0011F00E8A|nr:T9SS type A sorting domain-containing protein [Chryseobacterium sp. SN22]KAA0127388.1 T9SS type A sorting domain-containing protein [Chryseobacterium sp. SN22]
MKQTLFFLLASAGILSAQTTITKAFNDPVSGETVAYLGVVGTPDNSATGANTTFNNSSLAFAGSASTVYSTPTASEVSTFPGSTLKMTGTGNTVFYKQSASKLEITGLVTPDATLNLSANNGIFISYPTQYTTTTETDIAQGTFSSTALSGLCRGTITINPNASGTLILGAYTFTNVLRVRSVQTFNLYLPNDTNFIIPIGSITNTSYSYYNSSKKFPLLTTIQTVINVPLANINNQTTDGAQVLSSAVLSTGEINAGKAGLQVYPNPAQDFIGFKGKTGEYSTAKIYSVDGKLIKTSDIQSGKVQVSDLPAASYFIEVSGKNSQKPETSKFIKK